VAGVGGGGVEVGAASSAKLDGKKQSFILEPYAKAPVKLWDLDYHLLSDTDRRDLFGSRVTSQRLLRRLGGASYMTDGGPGMWSAGAKSALKNLLVTKVLHPVSGISCRPALSAQGGKREQHGCGLTLGP